MEEFSNCKLFYNSQTEGNQIILSTVFLNRNTSNKTETRIK